MLFNQSSLTYAFLCMISFLSVLPLRPTRNSLLKKTIMSTLSSQSADTKLLPLETWGLSCGNTWPKYMKAENRDKTSGKAQFIPREVKNAHFSYVKTESVPKPSFIAASDACARDIGLNPEEFQNPKFVDVFGGNDVLPGLDDPYCTVYGCHSYGQWFGQLGDGRAMALGEVLVKDDSGNTAR
jgi:hypothetical protein